MATDDKSDTASTDRIVILNPVSGSGDHAEAVRDRAATRGYEVRETQGEGDAVTLAREAADDGVSLIAAAGGDGTLNEIVRGVDRADALDRLTVGVIPVGTGNNFAGNVGITSIDEGFAALEEGDRRRIDLGRANGRPFVNSCIGGLTADASGETTSESKSRLGVLAYAINTLQAVSEFEGLRLTVTVWEDGRETPAWDGDALLVLVGNGRRFVHGASEQANMEDGRLDVVIVEDVSTIDLVEETILERLFGQDAPHVTRLQSPSLEITVRDADPIDFSLDGEMLEDRRLSLDVEPWALQIPVGEGYEPNPDA